jgi:hypothetical protein
MKNVHSTELSGNFIVSIIRENKFSLPAAIRHGYWKENITHPAEHEPVQGQRYTVQK